jgi:uncharacterized membrane protein YiaA
VGDEVNEDYTAQFKREWSEFLNEIRVALPGVQFLFGFLLTVPFTDRFANMGLLEHGAYFGCFLCTTVACAFLMAPSVYHRLHWRRDVVDKERMMRTCNRLAIAGVGLLALAMSAAVFMLSAHLLGVRPAAGITAVMGGLFAWLWFGLPLTRRGRDRERT